MRCTIRNALHLCRMRAGQSSWSNTSRSTGARPSPVPTSLAENRSVLSSRRSSHEPGGLTREVDRFFLVAGRLGVFLPGGERLFFDRADGVGDCIADLLKM